MIMRTERGQDVCFCGGFQGCDVDELSGPSDRLFVMEWVFLVIGSSRVISCGTKKGY